MRKKLGMEFVGMKNRGGQRSFCLILGVERENKIRLKLVRWTVSGPQL